MPPRLRINFVALLFVFLCSTQLLRAAEFMLGVDVFVAGYTHLVKGYRVGLITNQTGKNANGTPTIDVLYQHPDVDLRALFAPEHGIRGVIPAGESFESSVDKRTGLPIHTLYGGVDHRPTAASLADIDILIYDIQDVGSRAYTFIWSLAEAMAAAADHGKTVIVLDRPNPLGTLTSDGPITEPEWTSFLGLYPVPRVYGMTPGEFARYINREHKLRCRLVIMPMAGYRRSMQWQETGIHWTPPSPNIPSVASALCFAATGTIGVLGTMHIGIGTDHAFQIVAAPWINSTTMARALNEHGLPGVLFEPLEQIPDTGPHRNQRIGGVRLVITSPTTFLPSTTEVAILAHLIRDYPGHFAWNPDRNDAFDRAMGTSTVRLQLTQGIEATNIAQRWREELSQFDRRKQQYAIYHE